LDFSVCPMHLWWSGFWRKFESLNLNSHYFDSFMLWD
jgi:hypothetical protein